MIRTFQSFLRYLEWLCIELHKDETANIFYVIYYSFLIGDIWYKLGKEGFMDLKSGACVFSDKLVTIIFHVNLTKMEDFGSSETTVD